MRIVHVSDTHGPPMELPEADIYVHTGDLYPTIGAFISEGDHRSRKWVLTPARERMAQEKWAAKPDNQWRRYLASPDAPVFCVRGNHDFADIALTFAGCNVTEFVNNEIHSCLGLTITGHRGVPTINGRWNDEMTHPDLIDRAMAMPRADVYLTHYPPDGILDGDGWGRESWGLRGMANHMTMRVTPDDSFDRRILARHLFGHIHEQGGRMVEVGNVLFSNAATWFNVIDI